MTQGKLAKAMGVSRKTVNELCTGKRTVTVDTALVLGKVFGQECIHQNVKLELIKPGLYKKLLHSLIDLSRNISFSIIIVEHQPYIKFR